MKSENEVPEKCCLWCGHSTTNPMWLESEHPWRFQEKGKIIACTRFTSQLMLASDICGEYAMFDDVKTWWPLPPSIWPEDQWRDQVPPASTLAAALKGK
jgi:hypothetical protein